MSKIEDEKSFNAKMAEIDAKEEKLAEKIEASVETLKQWGLNPYSFSRLEKYLSFDSWFWKDGLLLLAGASPDGANINWNGYADILGGHINRPEINDVDFLDCSWGDAEIPASFEFGGDENYFKGDEMVEDKIKHKNLIESRLGNIYEHWINALIPHKERNSPRYFIEWACSKGIFIEWVDWAIEKGLYTPINENKDKVLKSKERETMVKIIHALAKNGYKYPERSTLKAMVQDFEINGNGVSEKTLKKYLDEFDNL